MRIHVKGPLKAFANHIWEMFTGYTSGWLTDKPFPLLRISVAPIEVPGAVRLLSADQEKNSVD